MKIKTKNRDKETNMIFFKNKFYRILEMVPHKMLYILHTPDNITFERRLILIWFTFFAKKQSNTLNPV